MENAHSLIFVGDNTREIAKIQDLNSDGTSKTGQDILSEAITLIRNFCMKRNFKIYYTRIWNRDGTTVFDVGSHFEFFHLTPEVNFNGNN